MCRLSHTHAPPISPDLIRESGGDIQAGRCLGEWLECGATCGVLFKRGPRAQACGRGVGRFRLHLCRVVEKGHCEIRIQLTLLPYSPPSSVAFIMLTHPPSPPEFGRLLSSTSSNPPLHNFYRFSQDFTGCQLVAVHLDRPISYILFSSAGSFLLHCNDNRLRTWAFISKLVF